MNYDQSLLFVIYYIIIGLLCGLSLYQFMVFFGRRKDYSNLGFSLLCLNYAAVLFLTRVYKQMPIYNETLFTVSYSLLSLSFGTIHSFFSFTIFNLKKVKNISIILIGITALSTIITLPIYIYTKNDSFVTLAFIVMGTYVAIYFMFLFYNVVKNKQYTNRKRKLVAVGYFLFSFVVVVIALHYVFFSRPISSYITVLSFIGIIIIFGYALTSSFNEEHFKLKELNETLEDKIEEGIAELKAERDEKAQMLLNIAHEIRNPLTVVSVSFTDFVRKWGKAEGNEELQAIKNGFDQMLRDVVNITDSELLKRGQLSYEHNKIIKLDDIKAKCKLYRQAASAKGVDLNFDIEKGLFMKSDPNALSRIINNILGNALKYTKLDGEIFVELKRVNEVEAQLIVKDDGLGMDKEQLARIFDPDQNIYKEKSNRQGLGIGLSLVKYALESLKGKINVESKPEKGTTFTVTLPLYFPQDGEMIESFIDKEYVLNYREGIEEETGLPIDRKVDILHVEDKPELFNTFKNYFKGRYNFHNAANGREALEMLKNLEPIIIISDIMMEEMDGIEFRNELLKVDKFKATPFIFLSARNEPEEIKALLKEGAADFIKKPIADIAELDVKIRQYIRMSELISEYEISRIEMYKDEVAGKAADKYNLTRKEYAVYDMILTGRSNGEIAKLLELSERTVENHNTAIYKKFGVKSKHCLLLKIFFDCDKPLE